jgi:hypothetical protein
MEVGEKEIEEGRAEDEVKAKDGTGLPLYEENPVLGYPSPL